MSGSDKSNPSNVKSAMGKPQSMFPFSIKQWRSAIDFWRNKYCKWIKNRQMPLLFLAFVKNICASGAAKWFGIYFTFRRLLERPFVFPWSSVNHYFTSFVLKTHSSMLVCVCLWCCVIGFVTSFCEVCKRKWVQNSLGWRILRETVDCFKNVSILVCLTSPPLGQLDPSQKDLRRPESSMKTLQAGMMSIASVHCIASFRGFNAPIIQSSNRCTTIAESRIKPWSTSVFSDARKNDIKWRKFWEQSVVGKYWIQPKTCGCPLSVTLMELLYLK